MTTAGRALGMLALVAPTLAAAYAAGGRFEQAIATADRSSLYRKREAYLEPTGADPGSASP